MPRRTASGRFAKTKRRTVRRRKARTTKRRKRRTRKLFGIL